MKPMVHVVDDDESLRTALIRFLQRSGFDVVGYGSTGDFLLRHPPDHHGCVLLDVHLPGPSGLELSAALKDQRIHLPVVFMTGRADVASSVAAMKGGAVDYLEKPIEPKTLLNAIHQALTRDEQARTSRREAQQLRAAFASLSDRERQVFDLIVAGRLNKQIADSLGVAERTVKTQRASLMTKLGVESPAELGRLAERLRAIEPQTKFS